MDIFETLKKLSNARKPTMRIYRDETGQIVEEPLNSDSAGSLNLINQPNPALEIKKFMFGH